jgi:hypothetical protein
VGICGIAFLLAGVIAYRVLQLHGCLTFVARDLAQAQEGGEGVKKTTYARGDGRVDAAMEDGLHHCQLLPRKGPCGGHVHGEGVVAEDLEKQSQGHAAWFPCRLGPSRQKKGTQVRGARKTLGRDVQDLATPNRAVKPPTTAIPSDSEYGRGNVILRYARKDMGVVVLDCHNRSALPVCILRGNVVGVEIAGNRVWRAIIECLEGLDHGYEGLVGSEAFKISDVLADEDLRPKRHGNGIFLMGPHGEHRGDLLMELNGKGSKSARAPENEFSACHFAHDRVVDVTQNRSIVDKKEICDSPQPA